MKRPFFCIHRVSNSPLLLLGLLSFFLSAGCASSSEKEPQYNVIRLYNESPAEIYDIELSAGGTITALDHLPAEHSPVSDRGVSPDPATAQISWRTAEGQSMQQDVAIASELPKGFRGVIVMRLLPDGNVKLEFVRYDELK